MRTVLLRALRALIVGVGATLVAPAALAQEPITTQAATQPSPGHFTLRFQTHWTHFDSDPTGLGREFDEVLYHPRLQYGITRSLSASLDVPLRSRFNSEPTSSDQFGVGDVTLQLKQRIVQEDFGPVDTWRASVSAGLQIRSGDSGFTSDGYNPLIGAQTHFIRGRHGLTGDLSYLFTTNGVSDPLLPGQGNADLLRYNGAYLFRLAPDEWQADTTGAWYLVGELNGLYETNGDNELLLAPGLMYEAKGWTLELGAQVPVWQDLKNRPEQAFTLILGVRVIF